MKAYKGFNQDLTCRGFQFTEGQTFEEPTAELCQTGFHACLEPMDVFSYYHPADGAVIHEVEVDDDVKVKPGSDSKVASRRITIGARIDVMGMVKAHLVLVWDRVAKARAKAAAIPASSGDQSTAASSGDRSTAASSGDQSTAASSGDRSTAASSGDQSTAASSGYQSTVKVTGSDSVAVAAGYRCTAAGVEGCLLVLVERDDDGHIIGHKAVMVGSKANGLRIKPGVAYILTDGKVCEVQS